MVATAIDSRLPVVVTAVASTTAIAADAEQTWKLLLEGRTGIRDISDTLDPALDLPVWIGARIAEDFDSQLSRVELRRLSYMQKMAVVLNRRLWEAAGSPTVDTRRLLVSISHAYGSTLDLATSYDDFKRRGLRAVSPLAVQMHMPNAPAAAVGLDRAAKAGVIAPAAADASGAIAIAEAWRLITMGEADVAICGGVEARIEPVPIAAFVKLGLLSTNNDNPETACRPFDRDRDGMVFGEAGALVLLESEEHARARGAAILAHVMGVGTTADTFDAVQPDPSGELAARAIERAVALAGLSAGEIDVINAHATGTKSGDLAESHAIRTAFGGHHPAVYSSKSALGHSMGAAGAVEAVLTVQSVRDDVVPATLNCDTIDPAIDLDVATGRPRRGRYRHALTNTFSLGGHNVALVLGKP